MQYSFTKTLSGLRDCLLRMQKVTTIALKPKVSIGFLVQRVLHDQKVGKLPKASPAPEWTNFARSRSAVPISRHMQDFDRNFVELLELYSPRVDSIVNDDVIYFVNFLAFPAAEWTWSF